MEREQPTVCVIIAGCDEKGWLGPCLRTLALSKYTPLRILYVDSASIDGSADFVRRNFPDVTVIALETRNGLAPANNAGARRALEIGAHYLFFLNPDTLTPPSLIGDVIEFMERRPEYGILSPLEHEYGSGSDALNSWTRQVLHRLDTHECSHEGVERQYADVSAFAGRSAHVVEPPAVRGAAMFVRRGVIEDIGFFDENYKTYYDDYEFCRRARRFGYRAGIFLGASIAHEEGGGSIAGTSRTQYREVMLRRNRFRYLVSDSQLPLTSRLLVGAKLLAGRCRQRMSSLLGMRKHILPAVRRSELHRICFVTYDWHTKKSGGGMASSIFALGGNLLARGIHVHVVTRGRHAGRYLDHGLEVSVLGPTAAERACRWVSRVHVWASRVEELLWSSRMYLAIRRLHRERAFDLIEVDEPGALVLFLVPWTRRRIVFRSHASYPLRSVGAQVGLWHRLRLRIFRHAVAYTAPSKAQAKLTAQALALPEVAVRVVGNALLPRSPKHRHERPPRTILFVGRLEQGKGVETLLDAYSHLLGVIHDAELILAGEFGESEGAEWRANIQKWIQKLPGTELLGHVPRDEMELLYQRADIFVLPSRQESFSLAVLEAMHHGLAVVLSDIPALRELISPGVTGLCVPCSDSAALAKALIKLCAEEEFCRRLGTSAQQSVWPKFSADVISQEMIAVYECALRESLATRSVSKVMRANRVPETFASKATKPEVERTFLRIGNEEAGNHPSRF